MTNTPKSDDHPDRVQIDETQAKGAQNVGLIWMLVGSLVAGVVVLGLVLAFFAGSLGEANHRGGPTAIGRAEASNFHAPAP
ncbi:MAG TPA: hypothetical protein VG166_05585 [Caulobacteraceae bacterium]|jgi:hypothetical protein|nr:hypothetical protein [Caulobacteraceae bacterium]